MKKIILVFVILFFTSCNFIEPNIENLLEPPKLTEEQRDISAAIQTAIGSKDYVLKYPKTGDNRSAYSFVDLNGDGEEEAVLFYKLPGEDETTRMLILARVDGSWQALEDWYGAKNEVLSVQFAPVMESLRNDIIVCWADENSRNFTATLYHFNNENHLERLFSDTGQYLYICDSDENGLNELIILNGATTENPTIQLARRRNMQSVMLSNKILLNTMVRDFEKVTFGKTTDGKPAVFIDELISGGMLATEVIVLDDLKLNNLMYSIENHEEVFAATIRYSNYCEDIDGDGFIEIPCSSPIKGYEDEITELFNYTDYSKMNADSLEFTRSALINTEMGYRIFVDEKFKSSITVKLGADGSEWRFYAFEGSLEQSNTELFRIKVSSLRDYQDKFELEEYTQIGQKGIFKYSVYVVNEEHKLAYTVEELAKMIELI